MMDCLRELGARRDELKSKLATAPVAVPDIHSNVADIYRRKVEHLAAMPNNPGESGEATANVRGPIRRTIPAPCVAWGKPDVKLVGDLGTILK
ncbi:MAG: hypothetical protein OXF40_13340 [Rhodospirillales bacterium]|nr:hypothetical protein [Rhodospirillales bacterium]